MDTTIIIESEFQDDSTSNLQFQNFEINFVALGIGIFLANNDEDKIKKADAGCVRGR